MSAAPSFLRVGVVQPRARAELQMPDNVDLATAAVAEAANAGASLLLFPEGFPGPICATTSYDAADELATAARDANITVCWSRVETAQDGRSYLVAYVHGPDGTQRLRYVRSHPATGDVHLALSGTSLAPGARIAPLFEVCGVPCGLLICSELWLAEVARVLAVRGAEVLLAPAGGGFGAVTANWQLIARARAIENQAYVMLTHSLFGTESGAALIAGPEGDVAASSGEGLLVGQLDLARARWLREQDDSMAEPKPFRSLPGLLRARRPQLYAELAQPVEGLYDYEAAARPREMSR